VLREEQLGAKRTFVCSLCAWEWDFPRLVCPGCGEDRNDALAVFTSEYFEHVRVEACDTCKSYIKAVDLTKHGLAIPVQSSRQSGVPGAEGDRGGAQQWTDGGRRAPRTQRECTG
jgi:hypothetical protein